VKQMSVSVTETHAAFIFKVDLESSVQGRVQWLSVVNTVMGFCVSLTVGSV